MEEIYLCISEGGSQSIERHSARDYFINYEDYTVVIKLSNDVIKELKELEEE